MRVTYHLAALVTIGLASPAHADDYRLEVGIADGASAAMFTVGVKLLDLDCKVCLVATVGGLAGMVFAAPVIHALEENYGRMGISIGARVLLPAVGLALATRDGFREKHAYWGFMAGFLAATALDIAIANDDDPQEKRVISFGRAF